MPAPRPGPSPGAGPGVREHLQLPGPGFRVGGHEGLGLLQHQPQPRIRVACLLALLCGSESPAGHHGRGLPRPGAWRRGEALGELPSPCEDVLPIRARREDALDPDRHPFLLVGLVNLLQELVQLALYCHEVLEGHAVRDGVLRLRQLIQQVLLPICLHAVLLLQRLELHAQ